MEYIKNHLKNNFHKWKDKKWYHQRFDGAPYVMSYIEEAEIVNNIKKKENTNFTVHFCFYEKGKADWYILDEDLRRVTKNIINHPVKDTSDYFINKWKQEDLAFNNVCKKIDNLDLSKLTNDDLFSLHKEFSEIYLNKISKSSLIDGFALGSDNLIAEMIRKLYNNSNIKNKLKFSEVFSKLTSPLHKSFLNEAEDSLFNIILQIKNINDWNSLSSIELWNKIKDNNLRFLLNKHKKSFFWINNNYVESFILDEIYFIEEIKQILKSKIDIKQRLLINKNRRINVIKEKENLIKILNPSEKLLRLIKISENFTYWQDERKKGLLLVTHYANLFFKEITKRKNIPIKLLHYMTPNEINLLKDRDFDQEELKKRYISSSYYYDLEGYDIITGKEVENLHNFLNNNELGNIKDFRGLSANTGKIIGHVKIIKSVKEISKIEEGDILVAVMTRTDYVPAMKKASAIITDEGGITSHAAIISREINKPCIIGTKIATQVLKDGDLVEVDANHGMVRKL